jgi:hypothetical protein
VSAFFSAKSGIAPNKDMRPNAVDLENDQITRIITNKVLCFSGIIL